MTIAVINYNAGNVQSVMNALSRIGVEAIISADPAAIKSASKVIFPGVGEAASTMRYLTAHGLDSVISSLTQPLLGICLGLQLLCQHSEEGDTVCLRKFPASVTRIRNMQKVPHIGWNSLVDLQGPLFRDITEGSYVYFVHSYCAALGEATVATTHYGTSFSAALQRDNFFAVQFHPEKSGLVGQKILENFLAL